MLQDFVFSIDCVFFCQTLWRSVLQLSLSPRIRLISMLLCNLDTKFPLRRASYRPFESLIVHSTFLLGPFFAFIRFARTDQGRHSFFITVDATWLSHKYQVNNNTLWPLFFQSWFQTAIFSNIFACSVKFVPNGQDWLPKVDIIAIPQTRIGNRKCPLSFPQHMPSQVCILSPKIVFFKWYFLYINKL